MKQDRRTDGSRAPSSTLVLANSDCLQNIGPNDFALMAVTLRAVHSYCSDAGATKKPTFYFSASSHNAADGHNAGICMGATDIARAY